MTRQAISPRLAIKTLSICGGGGGDDISKEEEAYRCCWNDDDREQVVDDEVFDVDCRARTAFPVHGLRRTRKERIIVSYLVLFFLTDR